MKRENLFASLAAFTSLTGFASLCYAQVCDTTSAGNLPADTAWEYNVDTDYDGIDDPDENGGCNLAEPAFAELGALTPGAYRAKGLTGNYTGSDGGNRRDLDWWRFTVTQPCYIKVSVSMSKDGVPFSALGDPATQSVVFVATGPATADNTVYCGDEGAAFIYGQGLTTDCPQVVESTLPNGTTSTRVPVPAGQHMIVVTTPFDDWPIRVRSTTRSTWRSWSSTTPRAAPARTAASKPTPPRAATTRCAATRCASSTRTAATWRGMRPASTSACRSAVCSCTSA